MPDAAQDTNENDNGDDVGDAETAIVLAYGLLYPLCFTRKILTNESRLASPADFPDYDFLLPN